jgi:hypothetical protein
LILCVQTWLHSDGNTTYHLPLQCLSVDHDLTDYRCCS